MRSRPARYSFLFFTVLMVSSLSFGQISSIQFGPSTEPPTFITFPLTVIGQGAAGFVAGGGSLWLLSNIHPLAGAVGWVAGSAFGVYTVGEASGHRGSYWYTLLGGTVGSLPFLASSSSFSNAVVVILSLSCEIIAYYVFKAPRSSEISSGALLRWQRMNSLSPQHLLPKILPETLQIPLLEIPF